MYSIPKPSSFSNLESSIIRNEVQPRPNSLEMNNVWHNAWLPTQQVNEFEFNYAIDSSLNDLSDQDSLHGVFDAVQLNTHLSKEANFSDYTAVRCLKANEESFEWQNLNDGDLSRLLENYRALRSEPISSTVAEPCSSRSSKPKNFIAIFVPIIPKPGTSYGNRAPITKARAVDMFSSFKLSPLFFLNMLGRPDYWAPQTRWETSSDKRFKSCDFFCQHPRWNLDVQGAPVSAGMRYEAGTRQIIYVIAHKEKDSLINSLQNMINNSMRNSASLITDPFDFHVLLSTLSLEASKYHVTHFRRFMWTQFNHVEEQIAGAKTKDRAELRDLTRQLQIISQNADSHIANAEVALFSARGIQAAHHRLHLALKSLPCNMERAADTIEFVIRSLEKQEMWFLNYKNRKDGMMSLVFNLVTQQDAANGMEIAADTKRDSTSMNAIAALTMVFLPGTFTATILGAGIFSANSGGNGIHVSNLWWLWIAFTVPLTIGIMAGWWQYSSKQKKDRERLRLEAEEKPKSEGDS